MATTATIPVNVSAEAAARIAELGMQREFEEMIEHIKQTVRGTSRIDVALEDSPEEPGDLGIVIRPHRAHPGGNDPAHRAWITWFVDAYPPDVCRHFCLFSFYEPANGR